MHSAFNLRQVSPSTAFPKRLGSMFVDLSRNKLQVNKDEMVEKLKEWESVNSKLKGDLSDASQQLCQKASDLALSRTELQKHRAEIDVSAI